MIGRAGWLCTSASSLHVIPPFLVIAAQPRSGPFRVELENKVTQGLRGQHARGKNAARHAVAHPMWASPAILRAHARSLPWEAPRGRGKRPRENWAGREGA